MSKAAPRKTLIVAPPYVQSSGKPFHGFDTAHHGCVPYNRTCEDE
jgi:hypothetical protein